MAPFPVTMDIVYVIMILMYTSAFTIPIISWLWRKWKARRGG